MGPGILREALDDLLGRLGVNHQEDLRGILQRASQQNETLVRQGIHESRVSLPTLLHVQRPSVLPGWAMAAGYRE